MKIEIGKRFFSSFVILLFKCAARVYNGRHMMPFLRSILCSCLDSCFSRFLPKWRRNGREALAALSRYINSYKPDIAEAELHTCCTLRDDLRRALDTWDKDESERLTKLVSVHCEPLPGFKRNPVVELAESFFVIMVVFLGIRTYYAQPFRIPTGSMQPTLNGIILHPVEEVPALPVRVWDALTLGSSYVDAVAETPKKLVNITDGLKWFIFSETTLHFDDGSRVAIPSASGAVIQYLMERGKITRSFTGSRLGTFKAGETIIRARVDAGDMVIVNRMAYHFRRPKRGETFVFDTRGINTSQSRGGNTLNDQQAATHYIKRLCGLPGDTLFVKTPNLLINGKPGEETGIARVQRREAPYNSTGYQSISGSLNPSAWLTDRGPVSLKAEGVPPVLREYAALGDNTVNSLDSRYWGPVHQFNVIGPASFTLWPFTWHWGLID